MKVKEYLLLVTSIVFLALTSCKKSFLDVDDTSQLYRQSYVKDLASMQQFMNGIYVMLNGSYEHGIGASYADAVADNLKPVTFGTQVLLSHYLWSQTATEKQEFSVGNASTSMNGSWTFGYQIIRACNFVIEEIDKYRGENSTSADKIKGEAFAIRAMVHFKQVNIFGQPYSYTPEASHPGIPYITTSDITKPFSRQTVAEVYSAMISDLNEAIQLLPQTVADTRYMNIAATKALLARIYLFKEDYTNAKALAVEISKQFSLLTIANGYPNDLFKDKMPLQSEILFRLTPQNLGAGTSSFLGRYLRGSLRRFTATNDIAGILMENPNDIRRNWATNVSGIWNVTKFPAGVTPEINPRPTMESSYYHPIIRSSEMFLIVAEGSLKTGDENTARIYLNAIRKRADPSIADVIATGSALLDSIYKERRKELCFEGLRMFDLQRLKLGVHRIDANTGAPTDLSYPSNKAISPIPLLDVRQEGLQQNPGY